MVEEVGAKWWEDRAVVTVSFVGRCDWATVPSYSSTNTGVGTHVLGRCDSSPRSADFHVREMIPDDLGGPDSIS